MTETLSTCTLLLCQYQNLHECMSAKSICEIAYMKIFLNKIFASCLFVYLEHLNTTLNYKNIQQTELNNCLAHNLIHLKHYKLHFFQGKLNL